MERGGGEAKLACLFSPHISVGCVPYLHGLVGGRGSHWWRHEGRPSLFHFFPGIRITKISDSNLGQDWRSRTPTTPARKVHIAFVVFVWRECWRLRYHRHHNIFSVCGYYLVWFPMFSNFYWLDWQKKKNLPVALAKLRQSINTNQSSSWFTFDLLLVIGRVHIRWFLSKCIDPPNCVHYWIWISS